MGATNIMRTLQCNLVVLALLATSSSMALAQNNAKEIMHQSPAELVALLNAPEASTFEKAKACQQLAVVGARDAIPALVALLNDEKLNVYARTALENLADPGVDEALRRAAAKLQGPQLLGVLDSIGRRRDPKAVPLLTERLNGNDAEIASAAANALGQIGTPDAAKSLLAALAQKQPALQAAAAGALLVLADQLVSVGKTEDAATLYEALPPLSDSNRLSLPKHIQVAALRGLFRAKGNQAMDRLLAQLDSPDKDFFNVGLAVVREIPGTEATAALAEKLPEIPPARQALLLRALADRKAPLPLPVIAAASKSTSLDVRKAAIYALTKHGDVSAVPLLLDLASLEGELAQEAKAALTTLPGNNVDVVIVSRLAGADPKSKAVLFEVIGDRRITSAEPLVRQALNDADADVRFAALGAMGQLVSLDNLELLTSRLLVAASPEESKTLQTALQTAALRMNDREQCAKKLVLCLEKAPAAKQEYLLTLLGRLGGKTALETVVALAKSNDSPMKDNAARVLGEWPSEDAAPALLTIAQNDPEEKYRLRALRGYIRIARQLRLPDAARLAMFDTVMQAAQRDDERQIAFDILARIPSKESLDRAVSHLNEPAMKTAAAAAAVKIARRLAASEPQAVAGAMRKVLAANTEGGAANLARQILDQCEAGPT